MTQRQWSVWRALVLLALVGVWCGLARTGNAASVEARGGGWAALPPDARQAVRAALAREQGYVSWSFVERALLVASDGDTWDRLGESVAISTDGTTIVAGAPQTFFGFYPAPGKAYVFVKPAEGWMGQLTETAVLQASNGVNEAEFGHAVAVSRDGQTVAVGAWQQANWSGAVYVFERLEGGWTGTLTESAMLRTTTPAFGDYLGSAVAMSQDGGAIVASAFGETIRGNANQGAVYIFQQPEGGWAGTVHESARLLASDGAVSDNLGESVAFDSDTVVAGAPRAYGSEFAEGAVYLYEKPFAGWAGTLTETVKLTASDGRVQDFFGRAVALQHDTLVVGAPEYWAEPGPGMAYVFLRLPGGWASVTESAKLLASDGQPDDELGASIALHEDTIVVGAIGVVGDNGVNQGAAYVYEKPAGGWSGVLYESQKVELSDGSPPFDTFAYALALSGDTLVAGAPYATNPLGGDGRAYVLEEMTQSHLLLSLTYQYHAHSGEMGVGTFHLFDDGTFTTEQDESGRWAYLPEQRALVLQFDTGDFCQALFGGRVRGATVEGRYACRDGSGGGGAWRGTLSLPEGGLGEAPLGDAALWEAAESEGVLAP